MDGLTAFARIRDRSLLAHLSEIEAFALAGVMEVVEVPAGGAVPRPERAEAAFFVVDGEVEVYASTTETDPIARSAEGRLLEVETFLGGASTWRYHWFCERPTVLLRLPASDLKSAIEGTEGLLNYLRRTHEDHGLRRLDNDLRLFGVPSAAAVRLIGGLKKASWQRLKEAYRQHPGFAIPIRGDLRAQLEVGGKKVPLGPFQRGEFFFLSDALERVKASPDAEFWYLSQAVWRKEVRHHELEDFRAIADPIAVKQASLEAEVADPEPEQPRLQVGIEQEDDGLSVADFKVEPKELARLHKKRRPVVRQHDEMDCGAACMSMVAKFYGKHIDIPTFRSLIHVTRDGASMLAMKSGAEAVGLEAIGVMSGVKGLRKLRVPFIALMDYHYVVVYEAGEERFVFADPAEGLVTRSTEEFKASWSKSALLLRPTEALAEYPKSKSAFLKYLRLLKGSWLPLLEILLASVLMFFFGLALPILLQYFVDSVLPSGDSGLVALLAIALLVIRVFQSGVSWISRYLMVHVTTRLDVLASVLFVRRLLELPLSFFSVRTVGDITTRMNELRRVRSIVLDQSMQILTVVLGGVINLVVIGLYSPTLLGVLMTCLLAPAAFVRYLAPRLTEKVRGVHKAESEWQTRTWEQFDGLATLGSMGAQVAARWRWNVDLNRTLSVRRNLGNVEAFSRSVSGFFDQGIRVVLLLAAIYLFAQGELSAGHVLAVSLMGQVVVTSAMSLMTSWHDFNELGVSLGRVDDIITAAGEPPGAEQANLPERFEGLLEARNVTFQYGSELSPVILDSVNLRIEPGETVAFVGRSGSGKSTLGYMFDLLYTPSEGEILFDGINHERLPLEHVRSQVAMIVQDNSIFSGSIIENIALGDPHPSFKRVMEAAVSADAHEFIARMSKGYSTELGESGEGLSGGQRQRINIARALYKNPAILIMDEATSALDAISEAKVVKNLKARKGTTIVIAHRLNTVMNADRIVVLDRGQIVEQGSHSELLVKRGHYHRLFAKQLAL